MSCMERKNDASSAENEAAESLLALVKMNPSTEKILNVQKSCEKNDHMNPTSGTDTFHSDIHIITSASQEKNMELEQSSGSSTPTCTIPRKRSVVIPEKELLLSTASSTSQTSIGQVNPPTSLKCVPEVLMYLLLERKHKDVIHFLSDESTFVIVNVNTFSKHLMKQYFNLTKFGCFVGKLERWGFKHWIDYSNKNCNIFYHPLFKKSDFASLEKIKYIPRSKDGGSISLTCTNLSSNDTLSMHTGNRFPSSIHDTAATLRNVVNRCHELSTLCHTQGSRDSPLFAEGIIPQSAVSSATKDIVEAAIECLMRDEDHTKNLLARRGGEIRQPNVSNEIERMVRIARTLGPPTNLPNTSQSFNNPEECAILPTSCVKEESTCLLKKT